MGIKAQMQENNAQLQEHYAYIPAMPKAEDVNHGQYTWHRYTVVDGAKGDAIGFVVDDSKTAYPMDGVHTDGFYYVLYGSPLKIVTWSDGTDEEIVAMVQAADNGQINLADYWAVGQERKVTLSAMAATGVSEKHVQQTVTMVLMNAGGKTLGTATPSGRKTCSFIVGMKNSLQESGNINPYSTANGGWNSSNRRTWCNSIFEDSFPATILPIFKRFKNITANSGASTGTTTSTDIFALPAEKEVFGSNKYGNSTAESSLTQFEWYKTAANRIKKLGDSGAAEKWWLRSAGNNSTSFCCVEDDGTSYQRGPAGSLGISPFGCI